MRATKKKIVIYLSTRFISALILSWSAISQNINLDNATRNTAKVPWGARQLAMYTKRIEYAQYWATPTNLQNGRYWVPYSLHERGHILLTTRKWITHAEVTFTLWGFYTGKFQHSGQNSWSIRASATCHFLAQSAWAQGKDSKRARERERERERRGGGIQLDIKRVVA